MAEFYQLQQELYVVTLVLTAVIFVSVWIFYPTNTALNYLLGAGVGLVYLRLLAKDVERLGSQKRKPSSSRLALVAGLLILATQLDRLQILPIFLGFLTYKGTLLVYTLRTTLLPRP